jgi:Na+/melibiose symporter-like transporter
VPLRGVARVIVATELGPWTLFFSVLAGCLILGLSTPSLESPYWLALNGPIPAAFDSLRGFRDTEIIAARDLYNIYVTEDPNDSKNSSFTWPKSSSRSSELFTNRRLRTTIMTCTLLMLTRAFSTVESVLTVPDFNGPSVSVLSVLSIMFTGSVCGLILTAWLFDRWGRRRMLISLLCGMFVFRLGLSLSLPNQLVQVVISIISASCFVSLQVAAEFIFTVYISEVFPLYYRGKMDPIRIRERVSDLKIEMGVAFTISFFYACVAILSIIAGFEKGLNITPSPLHIL